MKKVCILIMSIFLRAVLNFSSYILLFILIFINNMESLTVESMINVWKNHRSFVVIGGFASIFSLSVALYVFYYNHSDRYIVKTKITKKEQSVLEYFLTYLMPLLELNLNDSKTILINLILFIMIFVHQIQSNQIYLNVLLIFRGFKLYEDGNSNILITDMDIDSIRKKEILYSNNIGKVHIIRKKVNED